MFTQSTPAITSALSGALPDNAMRALTQALGNCNQPLAHRGPVAFSPPQTAQNGPGYMSGGRWSPQNYMYLLPTSESAQNVDVPGWPPPGGWGSSNYYGDTFNFPTNQQFSLNNYYGGPTVYNAGDQYTNNAYSTTVNANTTNTTNLNVSFINGLPVPGVPGPGGGAGQPGVAGDAGFPGGPGGPGAPGAPGVPGAPGGPGVAGAAGAAGVNGLRGINGLNGLVGAPGAPGAPGVNGINGVNGLDGLTLAYRLRRKWVGLWDGKPFIKDIGNGLHLQTKTVNIPEDVEFDPETCTVSLVPSPFNLTVVTGVTLDDPEIKGVAFRPAVALEDVALQAIIM